MIYRAKYESLSTNLLTQHPFHHMLSVNKTVVLSLTTQNYYYNGCVFIIWVEDG